MEAFELLAHMFYLKKKEIIKKKDEIITVKINQCRI